MLEFILSYYLGFYVLFDARDVYFEFKNNYSRSPANFSMDYKNEVLDQKTQDILQDLFINDVEND